MAKRLIFILLAFALIASAQNYVLNPFTGKLDRAPGPIKCSGGNCSIGATLLPLPVTVAASSPQSPTSTAFVYNNTAGALTVNLPAITAGNIGIQVCARNYTGKTGAITIDAPAATSIDVDGVNGTAGGTLVSSGALGDAACVVGVAVGQYVAYVSKGAWTNN